LRFRIDPPIFDLLVERTYLTVDDRATLEGQNKTLPGNVKTEHAAERDEFTGKQLYPPVTVQNSVFASFNANTKQLFMDCANGDTLGET
jgi:hypothetical protein